MSGRRYYRTPWWEYLMIFSALAVVPIIIVLTLALGTGSH